MIVRLAVGGPSVRIRFANAVDARPIFVGAAHVAVQVDGVAISPELNRSLTFRGRSSTVLMPGTVTTSDPVPLAVSPLQNLAISMFLPQDTGPPTSHLFGLRTAYISAPGNHVDRATFEVEATTQSYYWLTAVDVESSSGGTLVAFGDSLTDGVRSTLDGHHTWPAELAVRLRQRRHGDPIGVVNAGSDGELLLGDSRLEVSPLARFDRDVLGHSGVHWVIILEGFSDIQALSRPQAGRSAVTVDAITSVLVRLASRARLHGLRVFGGTLPPFGGAATFSEQGERVRLAVNEWIRASDAFDAVVDFDAALRHPANPQRIKAGLHADDFRHPNDAGYRAMARAVDIGLFTVARVRRAPHDVLAQRP